MGSGGSEDIHRANPAREIEKIAAATVRAWLGTRGALEDASQGGGPDFWIEYHDGRRAVGEVSWHEDAEIQKMWKTTFKQERHQVVPLPPDSGQWGVGLVRGAQIKALYQELPAFIATLAAEGETGLELAYLHPRDPLRLTAERLRISYIQRAGDQPSPSQTIFFVPPSGGVVPPDAESVVEWVESVIADPAYRDVTAKLLKVAEMDERHVFIMSGSQTPFWRQRAAVDDQRRPAETSAYPSPRHHPRLGRPPVDDTRRWELRSLVEYGRWMVIGSCAGA